MNMVARIRELSTPPKDDHDRAVLLLCDQYEALLQQGEPEGWKLVRRELTGEQMAAAASVLVEEYNLAAPDDCDRLQEMWEAMLSASPLPHAPGAETGTHSSRQAVLEESGPELLARLGTDAGKWAAEFRKVAISLGYSDMDEGWLIGWFANAMMNEHDKLIRTTTPPAEGETK